MLEKEKDISKETLLDAIENSLLQCMQESFWTKQIILKLSWIRETCEYQLYAEKDSCRGSGR